MKNNTQKGIALYVAVIVSGIVTLLAVAMADTAYRQIILARASENSQHAFYIANTGVECALYYDAYENAFPSNEDEDEIDEGTIRCADDTDVRDIDTEVDGNSATTTFMLDGITSNPETCAIITVGKHEYTESGSPRVGTLILVDGRYPCEGPRSAERSIRVRYGF